MPHARPEYAIVLAVIGICLAIGIPAFKRGDVVIGAIGIGAAIMVVAWSLLAIWRSRQ